MSQAGGLNGSLCDRASLTAFVLADGRVPRRSPSTRETIVRLNHNTGHTPFLSVLSKSYTNRLDLQIGEQMQRGLERQKLALHAALGKKRSN